MSTGNNSYLYEYSDKASWSLPGCVVSSWETNDDLPEFSMKDVENVVKAVGGGTTRKRTKNRGIYLTLGPRLSSRPRPNPVIQDKTKLYFSDFYRQNWVSQELMYLIRCKVSHGSECIRKRSIALDPGYMDLVGHHCCARQLLTSGVAKSKAADAEGHATLEKPINRPGSKKGRNLAIDTLGYVNSLHYDLCDLVIKSLVPLYIDRFVSQVKSSKRYLPSEKKKIINKVHKINSLIEIGLPTTCAHNIYLFLKISRSSLFVIAVHNV